MSFEEQTNWQTECTVFITVVVFFFATRPVLKIGEYHPGITQFYLVHILKEAVRVY